MPSNDEWDQLFASVRRSPFTEDPNHIPQESSAGAGNVAPSGWLQDGAVTADVIRAGSVETDKLAANAVTAAKIAAGTITANEIAAGTITATELAANSVTATQIAANAVTADEIAANTITAAEIAADAITTNELAANAVITENLLAGNVTSSRIELTISGKNFGANNGTAVLPGVFFDAHSTTGMYYDTGNASVNLAAGSSIGLLIDGTWAIVPGFGVRPYLDNAQDLGDSSHRWNTVYRVAESAVSDENLKRDIADAPLGLDFISALRPRVFRWRDTIDTQAKESVGVDVEALAAECRPHEAKIEAVRAAQLSGAVSDADAEYEVAMARVEINAAVDRHNAPVRRAAQQRRPGKRLHFGLIAQEVKQALDDAGVDPMNAGFWQENPDGEQALSYSELMIPLLRAVQELSAKNDDLTARVASLESAQGKHAEA